MGVGIGQPEETALTREWVTNLMGELAASIERNK
jgi:hypothetical protein